MQRKGCEATIELHNSSETNRYKAMRLHDGCSGVLSGEGKDNGEHENTTNPGKIA